MEAIKAVDLTQPYKGYRSRFWKYNPNSLTITLKHHGTPEYWIDLDRCRRSAQVLDWIIQISKKTWATDEIIADLILTLDEILDLQGNICGCGKDGKLVIEAWCRQRVKPDGTRTHG